MLLHSGWFWLLLSILVFWALGAYNRLVRLRAQVGQQFGPLENVLMNYQEVVHQAVTSAASAPQLWATAYAPDLGADQWTRLQVAASLCTVAMARMQTHPLEPDSVKALQDAASELQDAWLALIHPDVYYVSVPDQLKQRWIELDLLVQPEVQRFNLAIDEYNNAIAQYPAALLAKVFQFHPAAQL
jgi:LemA protein